MAVDIKALQIKVTAVGMKPAASGLASIADAAIRVGGALPAATRALENLQNVSFQSVSDQTRSVSDSIRGMKDVMNNVGDGGKFSTYMGKMATSMERLIKSSDGINNYIKQLQSIRSELQAIAATGITSLPSLPRSGGASGGGGGRGGASDVDKAAQAQRRLTKELEYQAVISEKGKIGLLEHKAAQLGMSQAATPYIQRIRAATTHTGEFTMSAKHMAAQMRMVPAQFTDIFTQLAGGQNPFLIMLQQGGQLRDMFGGFRTMFSAVGPMVLKFVTNPFVIAAAAVAGFTYAFYKSSQTLAEFNKATTLTNNYIGLTTESFAAISNQAGVISGSVGTATKALTAFAASGQVVNDNLLRMTAASSKFATATGMDIEEVVKQYTSLSDKPTEAIRKLDEQYKFLTASQLSQISSLENQGRATEAVTLAQNALADAHEKMAKQMYEQLGTLAKGWADLKAGVKSYWDELMRMGGAEDKQSKEFQSATTLVIRAIENKEKALALAEKTGRTISEQEMARYDYFIDKYRKMRDAIVDARRATIVKTESENAAKREEESLKSAITRVEVTGKLSSAREKLARIDKDIALIKGAKEGDVLDRETKLADLHRQRIDVLESLKDKNKSAGVDALASLDAQKKALEANLAGLKAQSFEYEKATEAQKELWKIEYKRDNRIKDDTSPQRIAYLNAIIKLEKQVKEEQEKAKANEDWSKDNSKLRDYIKALDEQNIAIRDGGLEKAKMSATDLKLAEAQSALTKGVDDHTRATLEERIALLLTAKEKERANTGAAAAQKIGRETVEYQEAATATLENYIAAQKEESKQIGMSTAQRKMRSEWLALESKKNLELAAVDARLSKERTTLTKEEVAGLEERRRVIMANYDAQQRAVNEQPLFKQLEGSSFSADASASYQDFYNGLTTRQQEFQSFYSSSYSLMTDAMANFFQTGKFNAKEFAVSMLKTITQVIAKLLILKAIEMATNSFGGGSAAAGSAGNSLANSSSSVLMNANGNAFGNNGVARFAKGGAFTNSIVSRPTSFAFASGGTFHNGLMGEAGPEAVMPLTRTSSGKLGVEAVGGSGGDNITINVSVASDGSSSTTTSGTSVEDQKMIGKALAAKIKDVIIQERRPGGVLA